MSGDGDDIKSIMKCIKPQEVLNASVEDAKNMILRLETIISLIKE